MICGSSIHAPMLINIVPEGFFFDTAARIALVLRGSLGCFLLEIWYYIKRAGR